MQVPAHLVTLGFNKRTLTYEDFEGECEREHILLLRPQMRTEGMYFTHRGRHCIALSTGLSGVQLWYAAWHEIAHYYLHPPALRFFSRGTLSKVEAEAQAIAVCAVLPEPFFRRILRREELHDFPVGLLKWRAQVLERFDL